MTTTRVHVPGLSNLRDVGGPTAGDGRVVRGERLYRSATPYFLDPDGAAELTRSTGLSTRIDLRSRMEVDEAPIPHLGTGVAALHLPLRSGGPWVPAPGRRSVADRVSAHYVRYLEHSRPTVAASLRAVAGAPGATLVHCTAGKDRTGVVVAVLLLAVGVAPDDIVADYGRTAEELDSMLAQLRSLPTYAERLAALPEEALTAEPATMVRFLERLETTHGAVHGYLAGCGVTDDDLALLRDALTGEPA